MIQTITDVLICMMLATTNFMFLMILNKLTILSRNLLAAASLPARSDDA